MTEIRRDTTPMHLDEIHAAFEAQRRDTLPIPLALEIAEAQRVDAAVCCACNGEGLVHPSVNERIGPVLEQDVDPDEPEPITLVEAAQ